MSDPLEKDVKEIKWKVEGIEKSIDLLVRANRKEITEDIMKFFGRSVVKAKVFLEVDGEKTVGQITESLKMKDENVSSILTDFDNEGLIQVKKITRAGKMYEKTEKVKILNLDKLLRKAFNLPNEKTRKFVKPEESHSRTTGE